MDKISVIVPVYKTEKYLEKCVGSIIAQTYGDLEIILVDDGSPDSSGSLCDELAASDSRIRVIHKTNGGLSSARNAGIDAASGEYLGFVDSDDWVEPEMFEILLDRLLVSGADISCCNMKRIREMDEVPIIRDLSLDAVFSGREAAERLLDDDAGILWHMGCKIYKAELFKDLRLRHGILFEDFQIMPQLMLRAGKVVCTGLPLYDYYESPGSILRSNYSVKLFDYVTVCRENIAFYRENCHEGYDRIREIYIGKCLDIIFRSYKSREWEPYRKDITDDLKKMSETDIYEKLRRNIRLKLQLLFFSPDLYYCAALMNRKVKTILHRDEIVYDTANGF